MPDDLEQATADAEWLVAAVLDADGHGGITPADLAVLFEMGPRCGWGSTFSVSRFRRALRALDRRAVVEVAGRWFARGGAQARRAQAIGTRICEAPRCSIDITLMRADARFCSVRCRVAGQRGRKRHQGVTDTPQRPSSAAPEYGQFSGSGPIARTPQFPGAIRNDGATDEEAR